MRRPRLRGGAVDPTFVEWLGTEIMAPHRARNGLLAAVEEDDPQRGRLLTAVAAEYIHYLVEDQWKRNRRDGGAGAGASAGAVTLDRFLVAKALGEIDPPLRAHAGRWLSGWTDPFPGGTKAQLARGVWRGPVAGDFLPNPKTVWGNTRVSIENDRILGVMGDGNCLYRALGVAMILHPRLIRRLLEVLRGLVYRRPDHRREDPVPDEFRPYLGLSMTFPLPATGLEMDSEIIRWNMDHKKLVARIAKYAQDWGRTKTYVRRPGQPTYSYVQRVARKFNGKAWLDAALVRAMRELCARRLEHQPQAPDLGDRIRADADDFGPNAITQSMSLTPGVNIAERLRSLSNRDRVPWYTQHVVRQMWQDASGAAVGALLQCFRVEEAHHFGPQAGAGAGAGRNKRVRGDVARVHVIHDIGVVPAGHGGELVTEEEGGVRVHHLWLWHHGEHFDVCNVPTQRDLDKYRARGEDPFTASATEGEMSDPVASPPRKKRARARSPHPVCVVDLTGTDQRAPRFRPEAAGENVRCTCCQFWLSLDQLQCPNCDTTQ